MKTRNMWDVIQILRDNAKARRSAALIFASQAAANKDPVEAAKDDGMALGLNGAADELEELASELEGEQFTLN